MIKFELWGNTYHVSASKGIVIVDLDGTLSDGMHRLHLLPTKDLHLTESWSEFNRRRLMIPRFKTRSILSTAFGYQVSASLS